jgi:uncharacterized protein YraI
MFERDVAAMLGWGKGQLAAVALGVSMVAGSLIGGAGVGAAPAGGAGYVKSANLDCWCATFYTTDYLNHRSGKGTSYSVLQVIPSGAQIVVSVDPADAGNGFFKAYYDGVWGWVHGDYITEGFNGPSAGFPASGTAVTTSVVNFRIGPGLGYDVISVVDSGVEVTISDDVENGFRYVQYDGSDGWIHDDYLGQGGGGPSAGFPYTETAVTNDSVNFREGPGTNFKVLDVLPAGTEVRISDELSDGFRYVMYGDRDGWIYDIYLGSGSNGGPSASFPAAGTTWTNDSVNFREGPGTNYKSLDYLAAGTEVIFSNETSNGFRYVWIDGVDGWVYDIYLD